MMLLGSLSWAAVAAIATVAGASVAALAFYVTSHRDKAVEVRKTRDVAREEAMELATVRGEAVADLHRELCNIKEDLVKERTDHMAAINRLQSALDLAREQSLETQQMLAHGVRALLVWVLGELEKSPPHVDVAVRAIREALNDADPRPPGQRRRAA